ncbi:tRNA lysidine(34) synthetase TilS [Chloroflexota bacterium]
MKSEGNPEQLEQRVLRFIEDNCLLSGQRRLVMAVSGGPDSVCLLHILVSHQKELGVELHVAHLNHQLRGAESEADAQYVADLARQLSIPATVEQREVKAYQGQRHISLEEAAREVRYAFLSSVARSAGADRVAVGHTRDDHIETILMHLIRGTGTRGLRGLQPCVVWRALGSDFAIIRPLLPLSREETVSYCRSQQLTPRLDTSNLSLSPLRNRIRQQLLPLLRSYNPAVTTALLRAARIAGDDLAFIDMETLRVWDEVVREHADTITLDKKRFLRLPPVLQRSLLRMSIERLLGNLMDIEMRHIEEMMNALPKSAGKKLDLPGGLIFSIDYDKYLIGSGNTMLASLTVTTDEFTLKVPGETLLPGWRVYATIISREQMGEASKHEETASRWSDKTGAGNIFTAYLDVDRTGTELVVRPRRRGDRFQPLGMSQPKKLGEFMIDAKIPRAWRDRIPVVASPRYIIWLVGWRMDDKAKVTEATQHILYLKFEPV